MLASRYVGLRKFTFVASFRSSLRILIGESASLVGVLVCPDMVCFACEVTYLQFCVIHCTIWEILQLCSDSSRPRNDKRWFSLLMVYVCVQVQWTVLFILGVQVTPGSNSFLFPRIETGVTLIEFEEV